MALLLYNKLYLLINIDFESAIDMKEETQNTAKLSSLIRLNTSKKAKKISGM